MLIAELLAVTSCGTGFSSVDSEEFSQPVLKSLLEENVNFKCQALTSGIC